MKSFVSCEHRVLFSVHLCCVVCDAMELLYDVSVHLFYCDDCV